MTPFRYTLLADGPSDRCLLRVIDFVLSRVAGLTDRGIVRQFANPSDLRVPGGGLEPKIRKAAELYPCDVLFVHRDAERRDAAEERHAEIQQAATAAGIADFVPVVPVRMTEAWLLIDVAAIHRAADNPNRRVPVRLPRVRDLEGIPDPKRVLFDLLVEASEKTGRRLQQFERDSSLAARRGRVADLISDFSPLEQLGAFNTFEAHARLVIERWTNASPPFGT